MKVSVGVDDWKLPIFERHLAGAGYVYEIHPGVTSDTRLLTVDTPDAGALGVVVLAANTEAARVKGSQGMTEDNNPNPPAPAPPTAADIQERALLALADVYVNALAALGINTFVLGFPTGSNPTITGQGYARLAGNSAILLNLIACLIQQLLPQDFENLRVEMNEGVYFQQHRLMAGPSKAAIITGKPN